MSPIALADNQLQLVLDHASVIPRLFVQRWLAAVADELTGRELSDAAVLDAVAKADRCICGVPA